MTQQEYEASVKASQDAAHEETMWGKPARDIVTGIGNNGGIKPVRAIWELVQNARDVVADGKRAKVVFTRKADSVEFQHDGIPFTHKTIEALIMQTSSKQATNAVQVGQYGTGFLTTHLFGLSFRLTAPLLTSEIYPRYYKIEEFLIDRSPNDKEAMKGNLQAQWNETQGWGKKFEDTTEKPYEHTIFRYKSDGEQAKLNAEDAFRDAPAMAPYVLTLNTNVESIEFNDEVNGTRMSFVCASPNAQKIDSLADCDVYKNVVKRTIVAEGKSEERDFFVYSLVSHEMTADENPCSKMTVMLPIKEDVDGSLRVVRFDEDLPLVYIYLPLLGTDSWGFNFMLHSSLFTCDKDSRDSLRLVGNGQNNDYQADANRELIALANKMICQFIDKNIISLKDAKYLAKAAFQTEQADKKLGEYYQSLQKFWRDKFESLTLVDNCAGGKCTVSSVKVLDPLLCAACETDSTLLDAVYGLIEKSRAWVVPVKEDMLYWSKTINRWYLYEQTNPHSLTINDLAAKVPLQTILQTDLLWLHRLCKYIVDSKQDSLLDIYTMIPNEALKLQKKTPMLHPVALADEVKRALVLMVPETTDLFVHPSFYDLLTFTEYGYANVKEHISSYINNHNAAQNNARDQIKNSKKHDMDYPSSTRQFNAKIYDDKKLSDELVKAMLVLFKAQLPEDSTGKPAELYNLLVEYYGVEMPENIKRLDKVYGLDDRTFYNSLTYDSLFKFSLSDDKVSKKEWIKNIVTLIYSLSDSRSLLNNYQVYPDQLGNYKYAEWLKKQSENVPDRALEIYDIIISKTTETDKSNSIKNTLLDKGYADSFIGTTVFDGLDSCSKIEDEVEKKGYSITTYEHQKLIVEIVENITSGKDATKWSALFGDLDSHKGQIMFSVIQSQTKRDSIFTIMKVEDDAKLKTIAELVKSLDFDKILQKSKDLLDQAAREENDKKFKKDLGSYVEELLLRELNAVMGSNVLQIPEPVENKQGGQDLILYINGKPFYYFEIKSRWTSDRSVLMSSMQHQRSYEKHPNYALLAADMIGYDMAKVRRHEFPDFEQVKDRISVIENIGELNERLKDATASDDTQVHVAGGYEVLVSQKVIEKEGVTFDVFIRHLVDTVRKAL